jgi:rod shape-determining protein MreD
VIYLFFSLLLFVLFSIQTALFETFLLGGIAPDLILITAVYCGIHFKKNSGIWVAILIGFFQDCLSGGLLGVNSLSKGLSGLFFCALKDKIIVEGIIPISFFIFVTSLVDGMIYFLAMTSLLGGQVKAGFFFSSVILFGVYNAVVAPFLFYVYKKAKGWVYFKFPSQALKVI